jgi:hypothetical protein
MIRTQVQLTEVQLKALRQLSAATGKSTAELIRNGVDLFLAGRHVTNAEERIERAVRVAGRFSSGTADGSSEHDRHLAEAFKR